MLWTAAGQITSNEINTAENDEWWNEIFKDVGYNIMRIPQLNVSSFDSIKTHEIRSTIHVLKNWKTWELYNITTYICNKSIYNGMYPSVFKRSSINPIYQKEKEPKCT